MNQVIQSTQSNSVPTFSVISEILDDVSKKYNNKTALVCDSEQLTYSELSKLSAQFAYYLKQEGLKKGDVIALVMPSILAYPIALFAAFRLGLTVVNVNPMYTFSEIEKVFGDSKVTATVVFAPMLANITKLSNVSSFKSVISVAPGPIKISNSNPVPEGVVDFVNALRIGDKGVWYNGWSQSDYPETSDIAFLQYTGGTTGAPKAAMLTHDNIVSCINQFLQMCTYIEPGSEVVLAPLPLYHIFGLVTGLLSSLSRGSTIILVSDPRDVPKMANILREWPVSIMYGVNALYSGLYHAGKLTKKDLLSLKLCGSGATALSKDVADKWLALSGCPIIEGYGMTETSGLISFMSENKYAQFGTVGFPVPNSEVSIRDEQGNKLAVNKIGELCIKGPQVMSGYLNNLEETVKTFYDDGALRTGDIARIDDKGYIWLVDRAKDMINVSGFNVYPNEVEQVIDTFEGVLESACVSAHDEKSGEVVKAYIVRENSKQVDIEQLLAHCRTQLTAYKIPKQIEFIAALPKSPVGKILRKNLKES